MSARATDDEEPRRVLVVDDDPAARDWLQRVLTRAGYEVMSEGTAAGGLRRAQERPDLVICDVALPDADGLALAGRLRADPRTSDVPILQISAVRTTPPERAAGLRAGADSYLTWPLDAEELLAVVAALQRVRAAETEARDALRRISRLHEITGGLARGGTVDDLAAGVAGTLERAFGATMVGIGILDDEGSALAMSSASFPAAIGRSWSPDEGTPLVRAVREQRMVVLDSRAALAAEYPGPGVALPAVEASVYLPLCTDAGSALGVLAVGFPWSTAPSPALLDDLQAVSDAIGQAMHRAQLAAAERRARDRLAQLQRLTAALARAEDEQAVAAAALAHGLPVVDADAGIVYSVDDAGNPQLLAAHGYGEHTDRAVYVLERLAGPHRSGTAAVRSWTADEVIDESGAPGEKTGVIADVGHARWSTVELRAGNRRIGMLCLSRSQDDPLTAEHRDRLTAVAEHVADALRRARLATGQRRAFLRLQQRLLPTALPDHPHWTLAAGYRPADDGSAVGGDWYDAVLGPQGELTLVIGDVAGHGTDAAATMSRLRHALHAFLAVGTPLATAVGLLNRQLVESATRSFATLLAVALPAGAGVATVVSAGHPAPMWLLGDRDVRLADAPPNRPLGVTADWTFRSAPSACPVDGNLLLYTDGMIERAGMDLDEGRQELAAALREHAGRTAAVQVDALIQACASPRDDSALLLARRRPGSRALAR